MIAEVPNLTNQRLATGTFANWLPHVPVMYALGADQGLINAMGEARDRPSLVLLPRWREPVIVWRALSLWTAAVIGVLHALQTGKRPEARDWSTVLRVVPGSSDDQGPIWSREGSHRQLRRLCEAVDEWICGRNLLRPAFVPTSTPGVAQRVDIVQSLQDRLAFELIFALTNSGEVLECSYCGQHFDAEYGALHPSPYRESGIPCPDCRAADVPHRTRERKRYQQRKAEEATRAAEPLQNMVNGDSEG